MYFPEVGYTDYLYLYTNYLMNYNSLAGSFDASKGELRKLNVTAGFGGCSYMAFQSDIDQYVQSMSEKVVDKWSIKPSLLEKMVDILAFMADKQEVTNMT